MGDRRDFDTECEWSVESGERVHVSSLRRVAYKGQIPEGPVCCGHFTWRKEACGDMWRESSEWKQHERKGGEGLTVREQ